MPVTASAIENHSSTDGAADTPDTTQRRRRPRARRHREVSVIVELADEEPDELAERRAMAAVDVEASSPPQPPTATEADRVRPEETTKSESKGPATNDKTCADDAATSAATAAEEEEEEDDDPEAAVRCIFLCEFHATAGPRITAQVPAGYISKELFDTVSRYIIPKLQLQRSFLSVSLLGHKILGYPVRIDNKLYARNAFYFNVCFVFAPTTRTVVYEPVVRKLTEYMLSMELSTKLLSQANDPAQIARLGRLLTQIRGDLNRKQMCMLQEGSSIIPLCIVPPPRKQPHIRPHGAAVLNDRFHQHAFGQWDLTTLRILPYVNGFNHVARISALADVAVALVLDCVRHLVLLGVASAVPVFQYSNVYRPTPKLARLAKCRDLQRRCLDRCSKSGRCRATVRDVFRMFASMAHGATFGELCVRFNPAALNINDRALVLFGLIEGLIRRVDKYPVTVSRNLFVDAARLAPGAGFGGGVLLGGGGGGAAFRSRASRPLPQQMDQHRHHYHHPAAGQQQQQYHHQHHHHQHNYQGCRSDGDRCTASTPRRKTTAGGTPTSPPPEAPPACHYNGLKSLDEICCARGISCQQLEQQLARDRHVIVLLR